LLNKSIYFLPKSDTNLSNGSVLKIIFVHVLTYKKYKINHIFNQLTALKITQPQFQTAN